MAELVDALDSKSSSFGSVGSIPTQGTLTSHVLRGFSLKIFNDLKENGFIKFYLSLFIIDHNGSNKSN